jgi:SNF2 family DNA or RNA helicase
VFRHLSQNALVCYLYHGGSRNVDMSLLVKQDIVITTYATLAYECKRGASMLQPIHWYRLVLDEGRNFLAQLSVLLALLANLRDI